MAARRPFWKWHRWKSMATINMHMKFEIEIPKQTWLMLRKPCRLQTDGRTDGQTDGQGESSIPPPPPPPPPTSLGGGIIIRSNFLLCWIPVFLWHLIGRAVSANFQTTPSSDSSRILWVSWRFLASNWSNNFRIFAHKSLVGLNSNLASELICVYVCVLGWWHLQTNCWFD